MRARARRAVDKARARRAEGGSGASGAGDRARARRAIGRARASSWAQFRGPEGLHAEGGEG